MQRISKCFLVLILFYYWNIYGQDVRMKGQKRVTQNPIIQTQEVTSSKSEILGVVLDGITGEALPSATVVILNEESKGTLTDLNGKFSFEFKEPTKVSLKIQYTGYETKELKDIQILKGKAKLITVTLKPKDLTTEEVVITSTVEQETEVAAILLQKRNMNLTDIYSSEIILRTSTNLNLNQALKRMPGVSYVEDKNLVIRGLYDKYILFTLNGVPVLSNRYEPQTFDYNLFPITGVNNIILNKSTNSSNFSGASSAWIDLRTTNIPDKNLFEVGTILQYNDMSSFKKQERFAYPGNPKFAFLKQIQGLPDDFPDTKTIQSLTSSSPEQQEIVNKFPNNLVNQEYFSTLNQRWYLKIDRKWTKNKNVFGFSTTTDVLYDSDPKTRLNIVTSKKDNEGKVPVTSKGIYQFFDTTHLLSNYIGAGFKNDKFSIEINNYFSTSTNNLTGSLSGQTLSGVRDPITNNIIQVYVPFYYNAKKFTTNQFNNSLAKIEYKFSAYHHLNVNYFNNFSVSEMPLTRMATYDSTFKLYLSLARRTFGEKFFYNYTTHQTEKQHGALLNHHISIGSSKNINIHSGVNFSINQREFKARYLGFFPVASSSFTLPPEAYHISNEANMFSNSNIGPNGFYLKEGTQNKDSYTGNNRLLALFTQPTWFINSHFHLTAGLRLEFFNQKMQPQVIDSTAVFLDTNTVAILPNLLLKYQPKEDFIFKLGYYQTVNRTPFQDLARFVYFDNFDGFRYSGNPRLTYCTQHHVEAKAEYYFSGKEIISLTGFFKHFINPFEQHRTAIATDSFAIRNIQQAQVYGFELEIRKSFDFVSDALDNLFFYGNFSFIRSATKDTMTGYISRKLQGQADYINNSGLIYSFTKQNLEIGAFYNYVGKLILYVGTNPDELPDIWQLPRHVLDLQISKKFKNLEMKLLLVDIFNQPYQRALLFGKNYDKNRDMIVYSTQRGFRTQLAINYKF